MTSEEGRLLDQLNAAVRADNAQQLRESSEGLESAVFDNGAFASELLSELTGIIRSDAYAQMSDGLFLIKIFEYNLDLLGDSQRKLLTQAIIDYVPRARDAIAAFLAMEVVAEIWRDQRSVAAILSVKERAGTEETLALAVHGFYWLAKKATDTSVRLKCLEHLETLSRHPAVAVNVEATAVLARLARVH